MFYAYRMIQIHQLCTREKDQEKKFRVCCFIFKVDEIRNYKRNRKSTIEDYNKKLFPMIRDYTLAEFGLSWWEGLKTEAKIEMLVCEDNLMKVEMELFGGELKFQSVGTTP